MNNGNWPGGNDGNPGEYPKPNDPQQPWSGSNAQNYGAGSENQDASAGGQWVGTGDDWSQQADNNSGQWSQPDAGQTAYNGQPTNWPPQQQYGASGQEEPTQQYGAGQGFGEEPTQQFNQPTEQYGSYGQSDQYGQQQYGQYGDQQYGQYGQGDGQNQYGQQYGQPDPQYGQPQYGDQGWQGAPPSGPGGLPQGDGSGGEGGGNKKLLWILLAAGAAVIAVVLVLVFTGVFSGGGNKDDASDSTPSATSTQGAGPTETTGPEPSTQAPAPTTQATPTTQAPPTGGGSGAVDLSAAQQWAEQEWGTYEKFTKSGTGNAEFELPEGITAGIVTATHTGSSIFFVDIEDAADGSYIDAPFITSDNFSGSAPWGLDSWTDVKKPKVKVESSGEWTLEFTSVASAPEFTGEGTGPGLFLYAGNGGTFTATHDGTSNYIVKQQSKGDSYAKLLINEIGVWSAPVTLQPGPGIIIVDADGKWSIK